ncbi:endolytic transglycosylase MltG [Nocardioides sp. cx-173]|uniref:endolytic transglycosylase MltG n=1 Tax=Nocardioides sp. cx-173 TaxID=2898796 RepID=UPI001E5B1501|nr:endolytic transglycosylase MltG [Nocardioides sp. cx-173]MCD4526063.1 endolytic transglycosylase MltG [Nocardioides sp. cx-173]UGB43756.1 endolytic transglycosylase MltG [Nocardioides sp. cx-173]
MSEPMNQSAADRADDPDLDEGSFVDDVYEPRPGGRRRKRRGVSGCLPVLIVLAVLGGLLYVGVTQGVDFVKDQFGEAEDYPGPGSGQVSFEVSSGDTATDIGRNLKDQGVVASVDAFVSAANGEPKAGGIQVGFYSLKKEMAAEDALAILIEPGNLVTNAITIPEGLRVVDIVDILAEKTDFKRGAFEKALAQPGKLGLPGYAEGNPEGYLFPSTYSFGPKDTPASMLKAMVDRWKQAAEDANLEAAAAELDLTPHELMTVASLVEAEGRGDDMPKIARVIYNRLADPSGPTVGKLQIDATVNYALDRSLVAIPTSEDLKVDSPYNTYEVVGLPPGPIEAPGDAAIQAASKPADGDWLFYVTVDLETGETKFTESYDEFLAYKQQLRDYCANESDRC